MKLKKVTVVEEVELCPCCERKLTLREVEKEVVFKDVNLSFKTELFVCDNCNIEIATIAQASDTQKEMADAYRKSIDLLTGEEIRQLRKNKNWSQLKLAEAIGVGIASIKRWEGGVVQTTSMDKLLKYFLVQSNCCEELTGNRDFSVGRTKLAFDQLESNLGHKLLVEDDKFLYGAKYMFYADMVAYRELGKSITGATYAALPMGPQLNNYRDLAPAIIKADTTHVEPLTAAEKQIIAKVAKKFPGDKDAFHASHKESVWKGLNPGALISYSSASKLKAI